ncbi:MAG: Biotin carboxylase [Candidatus Anoxychlamydiales bacterium]|nr:Biotin carboxylase [Candidatus Anoxychlamydiales bacterium]NGX41405.1 Biotin carboxylase [Candidatus Anoxychlamydiales bacterium]
MKVLIANRGEIAVRIIRACHDLGLPTVAVYSKADSEALHVLLADEAICIGDGPSIESYLKVANILSACEVTGADAIHPGYGFLSENAKFASICESCNLNFIGPSHESISKLGNKAKAKELAKKVKCPVIPGTNGVVNDVADALNEAKKIGFPLFIKASAGGGGKGIRIAKSEKEFVKQFIAAQTEAEASFNNSDIYLEKMIMNPRHIEVQIIADKHGHIVHLGERDCTIQRRRQKLIEETPSPKINAHLRKKLGAAAINIAKAAKYYSCGTVEFLLDEKNNFYFMEMNTRIQVEHTISEELTNVDIVKEQIKVAMGKRLSFKQKEIEFNGHVFEFRINAEDPSNNFQPSPGKLKYYIPPGGPNVRLDSACYSGYVIPPYYDSMIAKLIIKGKDRKDAIKIAKRALKEFHIQGVKSTIDFHLYMLEDEKFLNSDYNLNYVDDLISKGCKF